ncbi:YraN family protein [Flagellimonas sp. GZD32]|uniref:YraN family protein n=1 Tax=Flagellimonas cixiensis TaxID=3228750 RepID=UPI0035C8E7CE
MANHNNFGKLGEKMAKDHLLRLGYDICVQNYRFQKAEVDIIARKGDVLVIVEVKSRNKGFLEDISDVIHPKKVKLLTLAANHFVEENDLDVEVRFDIITVIKTKEKFEIEHFKNAFYFF